MTLSVPKCLVTNLHGQYQASRGCPDGMVKQTDSSLMHMLCKLEKANKQEDVVYLHCNDCDFEDDWQKVQGIHIKPGPKGCCQQPQYTASLPRHC